MVRRGSQGQRKPEYRCSLINIEDSQDHELDAILGELSELETQFSKEIIIEERKRSSDESSRDYSVISRVPGGTGREGAGGAGGSGGGGRNCSPDTDSAFCDNLSLISSCSADSTRIAEKRGSSGMSSSPSLNSQQDQEARLKAEKIKIAIEKIKEASVKKLFIKVFTSDGSAKSLLVDEKMTVAQVTRILAEKNHVTLDPKWALVELVPDLYMERVYEDNELLVENCLLWKVDSKNTLWFIERPEKIDLFLRPEVYLLGSSSSQRHEPMEEHCRQELVQEYFSSSGVGAPEVEGYIWLKSESKKSWKKFHFILRTSGLYYSPKGKKTSKDLLCLCTFDVNQVYYGVGWKRKFKAPTDHCFGIKHPQIQAKNPKYIRYLCVDTQKEMHQWVTGIRMAKNGSTLHDNYRGLVDEITHADLDLLVGKRGSTNSAMCLVGQGKAESCATNMHLTSPAMTPGSENKSFDSALSSGIRSEHFMDTLPASTTDLAKFDQRCNDNSARSSESPQTSTLRRTSKSSSSLSDKSSVEHGFESEHPAGGTIKKRPPAPPAPLAPHPDSSPNIRIGAQGALLRRSSSAERLAPGRNYEELQQLLDELHTNVRQAKDIQAKIKSSIDENGDGSVDPLPPPPPPPRTSSRLSLDGEELPPPPGELLQPLPSPHLRAPGTSTLPRKHLPPIAPKPSLNRVPGSPKFQKPSFGGQPVPKSYGTLPNPSKKSVKPPCDQKYSIKSGRRISFDDNIQLIEDSPIPPQPTTIAPGFLQGLERAVSSRLPPLSPPSLPAEPLYTSVQKPGLAPRHGALRYTPHHSPSPPRPVCCAPSLRCSGDSSPEGGRSFSTDSYRAWRAGGEGGDYWQAEPAPSPPSLYPCTPPSTSSFSSLYSRGSSEEPRLRPCDSLPRPSRTPSHSSVPSSPSPSTAGRLWGSFRNRSKPPVIDKRALSPYLKTAS